MDMGWLELPDYSERSERPEGKTNFGGVEQQKYPPKKSKKAGGV